MNGKDYVINALLDWDEQVAFIRKMIEKYCHDQSEKQEFYHILQLIENKQNDQLQNLSIIGEFSVGKSTMINALLRERLLPENAWQGTTVACTVIEDGPQYSLTVEQMNGNKSATVIYPDVESLRHAMLDATSDEQNSKAIRTLLVTLPSSLLHDHHFRIIDTPGTNSNDAWHGQKTAMYLEEQSDLSLILTSADMIFPQSLQNFVEDNCKPILNQCAFVITKWDDSDEELRATLLKRAENRVKQQFALERSLVLPYSALKVLSGDDHSDSILRELSLKTEQRLLSHMEENRLLGQKKRIILLYEKLLAMLSQKNEMIISKLQKQKNMLEHSKTADLQTFVQKISKDLTDDFNVQYMMYNKIFMDYIGNSALVQTIMNEFEAVLNRQSVSLNQLQNFVNDGLSKLTGRTIEAYYQEAWQETVDSIEEASQSSLKCFEEEFRKLYEKLEIIPVELTVSQEDMQRISAAQLDLSSAQSDIGSSVKKEKLITGGGTIAGGAIGTFLIPIPGVGTVIGSFIGAKLGNLISGQSSQNSVETIKKEILSSFHNFLTRDLIHEYGNRLEAIRNYMVTEMQKAMDGYVVAYHSRIDDMIKKQLDEEAKVMQELRLHDADRVEISRRKNSFALLRENIDGTGNIG